MAWGDPTEKMIRWARELMKRAGEDEDTYVHAFTRGRETSVDACTFDEVSGMIDDLKEQLGYT